MLPRMQVGIMLSENSVKSFGELLKSSKLVSIYNALITAYKISN